nr:hypothetical protein HJG59_010616 [Molossus molossus]
MWCEGIMDLKRTVCFVPVQIPAWFLHPRNGSLGLSVCICQRGSQIRKEGRRGRQEVEAGYSRSLQTPLCCLAQSILENCLLDLQEGTGWPVHQNTPCGKVSLVALLLSISPEWGVLTACLHVPVSIATWNPVVKKLHQCYGSLMTVILVGD